MTRERILVFFFFCSDLAIQAIRLRLEGVMSQLAQWTLDYIRGTVSVERIKSRLTIYDNLLLF